MQPFKLALRSFLAGALAVCAVKNITVDDADPRILYSPVSAWDRYQVGCFSNSLASADLWALQGDITSDRLNSTTSVTATPASACMKFNGTAIYFISFGLPSPTPDGYQVVLDGQTETKSLRVKSLMPMARFMAYSRTGLDASIEHQINISNPLNTVLNIDAFM